MCGEPERVFVWPHGETVFNPRVVGEGAPLVFTRVIVRAPVKNVSRVHWVDTPADAGAVTRSAAHH